MAKWQVAGVAALALALVGCGGSSTSPSGSGSSEGSGEISGTITVLTNRTDLVDTVFPEYAAEFEKEYPGTKVKFEAMTDYEGEVRTRMNTQDYGDVLLIPNSLSATDFPNFLEAIGTTEELSDTYRFVNSEGSYDGTVYGLAVTGNAQGIIYNKEVWEEAGLTDLPTTPEEFLEDLQTIKDNTDAIPLYTNYASGWGVGEAFEKHIGEVSADADARNEMTSTDAPWAEGTDHYVVDSLLWDAVERGLTESDPTTTDWEASKGMLGRGEIATMFLGSWAIVQMQSAADDPSVIGYMPFPYQVDGQYHSIIGGDYKMAVSKYSENKATAEAWVFWFADKSGFAESQGGITPRLDGPDPDTLSDFADLPIEYIELNAAPLGEEGLLNDIDSESEIGLWNPDYRQRLIDAARGARNETKEDIFKDLNAKWAAARAKVEG